VKLIGQRNVQRDGALVEQGFKLEAPEADRLTWSPESRTVLLGAGESKRILGGTTDVTWFQVVESFDA
jgi:hypothetical protein